MCLSVYVSVFVCVYVYVSVCLRICLFMCVCLCVCLFTYLSFYVCMFMCLYIYMSVCLCVCLFIYLSVYGSVYLFIHLAFCLYNNIICISVYNYVSLHFGIHVHMSFFPSWGWMTACLYLSLCPPIRLCVCMTFFLSVRVLVCPSTACLFVSSSVLSSGRKPISLATPNLINDTSHRIVIGTKQAAVVMTFYSTLKPCSHWRT